MKRTLRNWIAALLFVASLGGTTLTLATPQTTYAASCSSRLLTFPTWYRGLTDDKCNIKRPTGDDAISKFIWKIVLNAIEIGLQLVGYMAVAFIIYGGFKYMTGSGEAGEIMKAKNTIKNALIGLVISIFSVAIVTYVAGAF